MAPLTDEDRLGNFYEALADSLDAVSDAELLEECREDGMDPEAVAVEVKALIAAALARAEGEGTP
jgi:hypothetical protein